MLRYRHLRIALDGAKRPCRVRSSNAGHALFSGIADPQRARRTANTLMSRESFSGWGIRTIAQDEPRYNPMSYHNGSVWPHDNAIIAQGLARYGFKVEAARVFEGLIMPPRIRNHGDCQSCSVASCAGPTAVRPRILSPALLRPGLQRLPLAYWRRALAWSSHMIATRFGSGSPLCPAFSASW